MRNPERLRAVQVALRDMHHKLFELKGAEIVSLRETLDAEAQTVETAHAAWMAATNAVLVTRRMLDVVSDAHDAMAALYEADTELEDIVDSDTP